MPYQAVMEKKIGKDCPSDKHSPSYIIRKNNSTPRVLLFVYLVAIVWWDARIVAFI